MTGSRGALHATPRALYLPLRKLRTVALWAAEPFDWLHRRLTGKKSQPPLWLRRHVGPLAVYERSPAEISATIAVLGLVSPDSVVLDAGSGTGSMAFEFQRMLGPRGRYTGFDVHHAAVSWSRRAFANDARFRFELAEIATPYSSGFRGAVTAYQFPAADRSVDFVLAKSLFTHMLADEAQHYLNEIARVLKQSGTALVSAFLLEHPDVDAVRSDRMLQFRYGSGDVRWLAAAKPTAGVAYARDRFTRMVGDAGLTVGRSIDGYWRSETVAPNAQDLLVLRAAR